MTDAAGSRPDTGYTFGYYRETSPSFIDLCLLRAGVQPPTGERRTYLDLGFGWGVSANIHAAASGCEVWGTDFNPDHANQARAWAAAAGTDAHLYGEAFETFARRTDLPDFDYIVMHGIWSWVPAASRAVILDLIRRKLKPGGAVYVSYNALPGFSDILPVRHLLSTIAGTDSATGADVADAIARALAFGDRVRSAGAGYFMSAPGAVARLESIARLPPALLAHDHFNPTWTPAHFADVCAALSEAGLTYATSASLLDGMDELNLSDPQLALLAGLDDPVRRETLRDFFLNQSFRRDIYVRSPQRLSTQAQGLALASTLMTLSEPAAAIAFDSDTTEVALTHELYAPLVEAMDRAGGPATLGSLFADPAVASLPPALVLDALTVLIALGKAHPAHDAARAGAVAEACRKLNAAFCTRARQTAEVKHLAAPALGSGIPATRLDQLFLEARGRLGEAPAAWAREVETLFAEQDLAVVKDGRPLGDPAESLAELERLAGAFASDRLPSLRRLGVAD